MKTADGQGFDHEYVVQLTNALRDSVARLRQEAQTGQDPALKAYAAAMLPKVQQQLKDAQDAAGEIAKK